MTEPARRQFHGTVRHHGSDINYWVDGADEDPVVLLVHGATLDHTSFDEQAPHLVENGFRVVTLDIRGHGLSKPLGSAFNVEVLADDLRSLLDQLEVPRAIVVGHSMGGFVVQRFLRDFPDRVTAIVVIGATDLARKPAAGWRLMYKVLPVSLKRMPLESFHKRTLAELTESDSVRSWASEVMGVIPKDDFVEIILGGTRCMWFDQHFGKAYTIGVPFLLTHGVNDRANRGVFTKQSPKWAAKEPRCTYEPIPMAGHTAHMDNPDAFNRILTEFLLGLG